MLSDTFKSHIESCVGTSIKSVKHASGGCINLAAVLTFSDASKVFIKWSESSQEGMFEEEAKGLLELKKAAVIKVPEVITYLDSSKDGVPPYLALEALEEGKKKDFKLFGRLLAELHKVKSGSFGFSSNNFIGRLHQDNTLDSSWADFFFYRRLLPQVKLGRNSGWFDSSLESLFASKTATLNKILRSSNETPSLLHGDLWSGNVFWSTEGPALIDPAVYYGSREADIAFTEVFGGFKKEFYDSYNEAYPLEPGYGERKQVLNLYHLMTHSNLFGGSYVRSVYDCLSSL